ncbi:hypothetical protein Nepgr_022838 [Nepenthes gracilis]|uniref:Uncharacterized protein n=1 Tax=Nepenthes gracilis TaxID=150966 RepID=A0AAD3T1P6_NEPGR|nr:hypothetical protein Nepgr_022838 [Nepenthes gracilis]
MHPKVTLQEANRQLLKYTSSTQKIHIAGSAANSQGQQPHLSLIGTMNYPTAEQANYTASLQQECITKISSAIRQHTAANNVA